MEVLARLLREALDRVFTVDLPRGVRVSLRGEPRVSIVPRFDARGRAYVTIQFEVEERKETS